VVAGPASMFLARRCIACFGRAHESTWMQSAAFWGHSGTRGLSVTPACLSVHTCSCLPCGTPGCCVRCYHCIAGRGTMLPRVCRVRSSRNLQRVGLADAPTNTQTASTQGSHTLSISKHTPKAACGQRSCIIMLVHHRRDLRTWPPCWDTAAPSCAVLLTSSKTTHDMQPRR
jgi:hypothetical protein